MTKLVWDKIIARPFETGVERGVFYLRPSDVGVAWNGLISVTQTPSMVGTDGFYIDGRKYANGKMIEVFTAKLEAYTYPDEFKEGNFFGLCYRTNVGVDEYRLHLLYNIRASSPDLTHETLGGSKDSIAFTWNLDTLPIQVPRFKPTSYLILDSTRTSKSLMIEIEKILYGTDTTAPRLPYPPELLDLYKVWVAGYGHGPYGHGAYGGN